MAIVADEAVGYEARWSARTSIADPSAGHGTAPVNCWLLRPRPTAAAQQALRSVDPGVAEVMRVGVAASLAECVTPTAVPRPRSTRRRPVLSGFPAAGSPGHLSQCDRR
jgi:hypothetical protein